jgi:hypothetical protein
MERSIVEMSSDIARQMRNFDGGDGDRIDPVAQALRRLFTRTDLCPCQFQRNGGTWCRQCVLDHQAIDAAWKATEPEKAAV